MTKIIRNEIEELFFPKGIWSFYTYGVAFLFFIIGLNFVYMFIDELVNSNNGVNYFIEFALLLFFIFLSPIFYVFKSENLYVNKSDRYFRIKNKIIPFNDIVSIKYNYGYLKPHKYTIFSTIFYFVLENGEKVKFSTFFRGSSDKLKEQLLKMNFKVKKCKYKDL